MLDGLLKDTLDLAPTLGSHADSCPGIFPSHRPAQPRLRRAHFSHYSDAGNAQRLSGFLNCAASEISHFHDSAFPFIKRRELAEGFIKGH
jgi:hypothetical protein